MSLSTTSKQFLNTSRDGDSTTSLGSLFQCYPHRGKTVAHPLHRAESLLQTKECKITLPLHILIAIADMNVNCFLASI